MVSQFSRPNTVDRWTAALKRAREEGVTVRQLTASGAWIATSASDPYAAYEVSIHRCTCKAAEFGFDPVCKHRAALRAHLEVALDGVSRERERSVLAA